MFVKDLVDSVLLKPLEDGADELYVVAGYATPNMVSHFASSVPDDINLKIHLIVGMTAFNGISVSVHEGFKDLIRNHQRNISLFECSYIYKNSPVNSNLYIWAKQGKMIKAFTGSAGFTQGAFYLGRRETMEVVNPDEALAYYNNLISDTIYASHNEVEEYIPIYSTHSVLDNEENVISALEASELPRVTLSLLTKKGETGVASGVNWGQRKGREKNQAYIHVPASVRRECFFPPANTVFTALTDDRKCLLLRIEQQGDKAITTPTSNSLLGEYLRNRLNLANGAYIHKSDLERYGRTDVTFYKLDENQYFMDFGI